jgi:hypothetical protein
MLIMKNKDLRNDGGKRKKEEWARPIFEEEQPAASRQLSRCPRRIWSPARVSISGP